MGSVISISGLVKSYGSFRALDGLDLEVAEGEVHGFLGPNGSGKTTTIRVLLGLLRADAGTVSLLGGDPWRDAVSLHHRLAYVPGDVSLWPKLSGGETIDLLGRLRGDVDRRKRDELVQRFELDPTKKARSYSKGNRQKVALVAALASSAELLILDEPTSGLDPVMEAVFQACVAEVKAEGRTVLLSSHILAEVEALCERVSIIREGRTVQTGSLHDLRELTRTSITAETERPVDLAGIDGVHGLTVDGDRVQLDIDGPHLDAVIAALSAAGLRSLSSAPPTLEELFLRHYGDELAADLGDAPPVTFAAGTGGMVRLVVARDKWRMGVWLVGILILVLTTVSSTKGLYPDQASLDAAAAVSRDNPAALAFNGPDQALDTIGGQIAFQLGSVALTMIGLMSILLVGRLTRGEEDSGRLELVRALPVSRQAPLTSTVIVVGGLLVKIGVLSTLSLLLFSLPLAGSISMGLSFTVVGLVFMGIALVTAQVSENPRVASGIAGGILGAAFVLRAVGDMGDGKASWLSPIGWGQKARPYAGEVWWPLALCVVVAAGLILIARWVMEHRDFGAGLIPARPGPAEAAPRLGSPIGLATRLDRGAVLWWSLGAIAMAGAYGSLAGSIDDFVTDNESLAKILGGTSGASLTDGFLATALILTALVTTGMVLQVVLRLRSEEAEGRGEVVLTTRTTRTAWVGSHLAIALVASAVAQLAGGAALGAAYWATGGGADEVPRLAVAALAYVPAVWAVGAAAVALYGVVPRFAVWSWSILVLATILAMFGPLLDLPQWVMDLSPFEHIPFVPAADLAAIPILGVTLSAVLLGAVGFIGFQRRDLGV